MAKKKDMEDSGSISVMSGFKRVEEDDPFMEKYGFYTGEVCSDYDTLKKAMEIKQNPKRMAAIKDYAEKEIDDAADIVDVVKEKKKDKPANSGEELYVSDKNNYDNYKEDDE